MNATESGRRAEDTGRSEKRTPRDAGTAPRGARGAGTAPTTQNTQTTQQTRTSRAAKTKRPTAPKSSRNALGKYGEDLAVRRLTEAGMRILDRNWRCRDGEIDIVAVDGDALVVCEVKTRRAGWYEHPMAAVRAQKTARLRLLAERWLERHGGPPPGGVRIDVIGILLPARGAPVVEHARGVA
nr:YraN family protein [Streptomyces noursei]